MVVIGIPCQEATAKVQVFPRGSTYEIDQAVRALPAELRALSPRAAARLQLAHDDPGALSTPDTTTVSLRKDLITGQWHPAPWKPDGDNIDILLDASDDDGSSGEGDDALIIGPAVAALDKRVFGSSKSLRNRVRIISVEHGAHTIERIRFQERTNRLGVTNMVPDRRSSLAEAALQHPKLQPRMEQQQATSWNPAPEILALEALKRLKNSVKRGHPRHEQTRHRNAVAATLRTLAEDASARCDAVHPVAPTEADQWDALSRIAASADQRLVVCTAFLNPQFTAEYLARMSDWPPHIELFIAYGHADDQPISVHEERARQFEQALSAQGRKVHVSLTRRRTHAKVAINDRLQAWLGSCNLFSCAPGSDVVELGVELEGPPANELRKELENLVPPSETHHLPAAVEPPVFALAEDVASRVTQFIQNLLDQAWSPDLEWIDACERVLQRISLRPRYALVNTDQHRDLLLTLCQGAEKHLVLMTDRIKPAGLDKQLTDVLVGHPDRIPERTSRFTYQVVWGRDDPRATKTSPDIEECRHLYSGLRQAITSRQWERKKAWRAANPGRRDPNFDTWFFPREAQGPFMVHSKGILVDDRRAFLTSDNLLVYGSTRKADDSTELGILIDSPRTAFILRGELEWACPEIQDRWDYDRYKSTAAYLARELQLEHGDALLGQVIGAVIEVAQANNAPGDVMRKALDLDAGEAGLAGFGKRLVDKCLLDIDPQALDESERTGVPIAEIGVALPSASGTWVPIDNKGANPSE